MWGMTNSKEPRSLLATREGEVCMKHPDHHMRHPRGHLGDRASAQGTRGCAWRDDQFGRGQNPVLGWSDPTFAHGSVAKSGVAPAQHRVLPASKLIVAPCATSCSLCTCSIAKVTARVTHMVIWVFHAHFTFPRCK